VFTEIKQEIASYINRVLTLMSRDGHSKIGRLFLPDENLEAKS
jgi:hypothetical protein